MAGHLREGRGEHRDDLLVHRADDLAEFLAGGPNVVQLLLEELVSLLQGIKLGQGQWIDGPHELELPLQLGDPGCRQDSVGQHRAGCLDGRLGLPIELGTNGGRNVLNPHPGLGPLDLEPGLTVPGLTESGLGLGPLSTETVQSGGHGPDPLGLLATTLPEHLESGVDRGHSDVNGLDQMTGGRFTADQVVPLGRGGRPLIGELFKAGP